MATLTQAQNEALVKLLLVARYQDKKLSLSRLLINYSGLRLFNLKPLFREKLPLCVKL